MKERLILQARAQKEGWMDKANCKGMNPDLFFPERGNTIGVRLAKAVCNECSVKEECLEFAIHGQEKFGVWGGLSERQRRVIRKQRLGWEDING